MGHNEKVLKFFQFVCRFNFGNFPIEELKKFLKMGLIFSFIIGIYWTLKSPKDAIFIQLVSSYHLPMAKAVSVVTLFPLVMFYTSLLEKNSKERMLIILPSFYGIFILAFSIIMIFAQGEPGDISQKSSFAINSREILGYLWYVFVDSFGALVVALFWAFAADTTEPEQAKRGFPLVVTIGQIGGIIFPFTIGGLPHRLSFETDFLSIFILGILTLLIIPLVRYFLKTTPPNLLTSFKGKNQNQICLKQESGFLEGLKLLIKNKYLLGIFFANFIYEIIVTIFDFNFKLSASTEYTGVALSNYLCIYGSSVNVVSILCLLFGISNITRFLGVGTALALMPIIVGAALLGFLSLNSLPFLFLLMVGSKAINYALNGPALKQLYIPTTPDVRFKAQAWIETFGSSLSKQTGSIFNMSLAPLQKTLGPLAGKSHYLLLSGSICFPLLFVWLIIAIYLGRSFKKAIKDNNVIC